MPIFKTYRKIMGRLLPVVSIYVIIFFAITIGLMNANQTNNDSFEASKSKIAVTDLDQSALSQELVTMLSEKFQMITKYETEKEIRDALFYGQIQYYLEIPVDFSKTIMESEIPKLKTISSQNSTSVYYVENEINKILNASRLYVLSGFSESEMIENFKETLQKEAVVTIHNEKKEALLLDGARYYFNITNYIFFGILIIIVGLIMQIFHKIDLKRRNLISPISRNRYQFELFLGNLVAMTGVWLVFALGSLYFFKGAMFTTGGLLLLLNSFIFAIVVLSISFLIGKIVKSEEVTSGLSNVLGLGTSFLCGAFVPQAMLGDSVLSVTQFLPSFWFIKNNDLIAESVDFGSLFYQNYFMGIGIQVLFIVGIYFITQYISKKKEQSV